MGRLVYEGGKEGVWPQTCLPAGCRQVTRIDTDVATNSTKEGKIMRTTSSFEGNKEQILFFEFTSLLQITDNEINQQKNTEYDTAEDISLLLIVAGEFGIIE